MDRCHCGPASRPGAALRSISRITSASHWNRRNARIVRTATKSWRLPDSLLWWRSTDNAYFGERHSPGAAAFGTPQDLIIWTAVIRYW
jgi:hypothetical protein